MDILIKLNAGFLVYIKIVYIMVNRWKLDNGEVVIPCMTYK